MIKPGRMNHLIIFQVKTQALDAMNAPIDGTWANAFTVPAELVKSDSREYQDALKRNSEMTVLFRIRYQAGIDADLHQVLFNLDPDASPLGFQTYDIFPPIDPEGKRRELLISGKEAK